MGYVGHFVASAILRIWHATSQNSWRQLPRPASTASVHAPGRDADRILLVGSGGTVGYGVLSHDLGVAGHLARRVSQITGRGTDIDVIAGPDMGPLAARAALASVNLARYDAVMFTFGGLEALQLMPRGRWRGQLRSLVAFIGGAAPASLTVIVIAVAAMPSIIPMPARFAPFVIRAGKALNEETIALAAVDPQMRFVPFVPRAGDFSSLARGDVYNEWSAMVAPDVALALDAHAAHLDDEVDEAARMRAVTAMNLHDHPDERVAKIVASARDLFGAHGASLNVIEDDRQWACASSGVPHAGVPRDESLCNTTIGTPGLFVVEDTLEDDRYRARSWTTGPDAVRFYAGYPVEAPDGQRVGALCIVDTKPRVFAGSDAMLLRDLALSLQALLWENALRRQ